MKPTLFSLLLAAFSFGSKGMAQSTTSMSNSNTNLEEARKAIAESNEKFGRFLGQDDGSVASLYADDAWIMPSNMPYLHGHDNILKFFSESYRLGVRSGKFTTLDVFGDGNEYVTEVGLVQIFDANGNLFTDDKYMVIWKNTDKGWKMFRDTFNSNKPRK